MKRIIHDGILLHGSKLKVSLLVLFIFLAAIVFLTFRGFEKREVEKIEQYVQILLRNEINASNPYSISKALVDLKVVGLFEAALLRDALSSDEAFYDTLTTNNRSWGISDFQKVHKFSLASIRGTKFELLFIRPINYFALVVEILIYTFILTLAVLIPNRLNKLISESKKKIQLVEAEKGQIIELTKQIQHDIASPLTVLRTVAAVSKAQNPEVYQVLEGAIKRTEEIFNDFSQKKEKLDPTDLLICLNCIVSEKKAIWGDRFDYKIHLLNAQSDKSELLVTCPEGYLKRILSNILNNSYDAVFEQNNYSQHCAAQPAKLYSTINVDVLDAHILVKITDNGPGFHEEVLPQIGNKGFTFGKTEKGKSGKGIGLYHAKKILGDLGGYIEFANQETSGATVSCYLPKS